MAEAKVLQKPQQLNVVFIGAPKAGKTAILRRQKKENFLETYESTTEANLETYISQRGNTLNITDISGAKIFEDSALVNSHIKSANAVVFVIDGTKKSIKIPEHIKKQLILANAFSPNFYITLSKCDVENYYISPGNIKEYIATDPELSFLYNAPIIFSSAKTDEGIGELFTQIETDALEQKNSFKQTEAGITPQKKQISQQLTVDELKSQRNLWIAASIGAGILGAAIGATLGFAVGGPIGALIGGVVGAAVFGGLAVPGIVKYGYKLNKLSAETMDNSPEKTQKVPLTVSRNLTSHSKPPVSQPGPQPRGNTPIESKIRKSEESRKTTGKFT